MHLDARLGVCPGYGWEGGPEFQTRIVSLLNGRERRNADWAQPRHRYSAPFLNISREAYREIKRMFLVCQGQLHAFRFRDELDYQAEDEQFAIGDGVTTVFQLSKLSFVDGVDYSRNVYALVGEPDVEANGVPATVTADVERGTVEFDTAPANGTVLTWSGEFDMWVRFSQDYLPFTLDNPNATNGSVNLLEVPPPELVTSDS